MTTPGQCAYEAWRRSSPVFEAEEPVWGSILSSERAAWEAAAKQAREDVLRQFEALQERLWQEFQREHSTGVIEIYTKTHAACDLKDLIAKLREDGT